jgi:hypothetical protein
MDALSTVASPALHAVTSGMREDAPGRVEASSNMAYRREAAGTTRQGGGLEELAAQVGAKPAAQAEEQTSAPTESEPGLLGRAVGADAAHDLAGTDPSSQIEGHTSAGQRHVARLNEAERQRHRQRVIHEGEYGAALVSRAEREAPERIARLALEAEPGLGVIERIGAGRKEDRARRLQGKALSRLPRQASWESEA